MSKIASSKSSSYEGGRGGRGWMYGGLALQGVGGLMSGLAGYSSGMASAGAMQQEAGNIRKEAEAAYRHGVGQEHLMRKNEGYALSEARAAAGGRGFLSSGSGNVEEETVAKQYEQAIMAEAVARENARRSAMNQADLVEWQARQQKRSSKWGLVGDMVGLASGLASGYGAIAGLTSVAGRVAGGGVK